MTPRFAVVGRVNEGKSSMIATLTENDGVAVGPEPGTTRRCHTYRMEYAGQTLFEVIDTPGFQEPEAALEWLQQQAPASALERPRVVKRFVETFRKDPDKRFEDECELLSPILSGAYILYVADCSHPYRPSYEAELEILRWTGVPRLALINQIGNDDYISEWQQALSQYFNVLKPFNAHQSYFRDRLQILQTLQILDQGVKEPLNRAIEAISSLQEERRRQAAMIIARLVASAAGMTLEVAYDLEEIPEDLRQEMHQRYQQRMTSLEGTARQQIERLYQFQRLQRQEKELSSQLFQQELFSAVTWEFLGLSRSQLIAGGAFAGAAAGSVLDAAVGGHSFLAGALVGSVIGAGSTGFLSWASPQRKMVGMQICGTQLVIGPIKDPNFPWIVLDRALLHYRALMTRTHAMRDTLSVPESSGTSGLVSDWALKARARVFRVLAKLRKNASDDKAMLNLAHELEAILATLE